MADAKPAEGLRIRIRLKAYDEEVLPVRNAYLGYKYCRTALDNGFRNGDIIVAIDGGEANSSKEVIEKLVIEGKRNVTVSRNGETTTVCLPENFGEQFIEAKEKQFMTPVIPFVVDSVMPQSAAKIGRAHV